MLKKIVAEKYYSGNIHNYMGCTRNYTLSEEIWNAATHCVGIAFSIAALSVMVTLAAVNSDAWSIVSCSIFGASMLMVYTASSAYHAIPYEKLKPILKKFDHIAIYYLIAGSYTPFMLVPMRSATETTAWVVFGIVWGLAILGTILKIFAGGPGTKFWSISLYLAMGWLIIFVSGKLFSVLLPPTDGMPDNHCYPMWYNGHGIDIGRLHRGYWLPVKPGWYYGCGEYGAEGLDSAEVMEECYPREWLREPFDPGHIVRSQTKSFSGFFYDAQEDMQGWISRSQRYQAFAARMMTEAFRRDDRMVSNAIHLFIDAWPSGWMKSIMDCKRIPKQAYFAYRDALAPLLVSLRTDRFAYTAGETIQIEAFLCNDTAKSGAYTLAFELYNEQNKLIQTGRVPAHADACRAVYIASAEFPAETAQDRETLTLRAVLLDGNGDVVNDAEQKLTVFQDVTVVPNDNVVILKLEPGLHTVAGETVTVKPCGMLPLHFVSRKTGHPAVAEFNEQDFSYWYDAKEDCITPLLDTTFTVEGFTPILLSNNMDEQGNWGPVLAAAEKLYEGKHYVICQLDLRQENPVAKRFLRNLYRLGTK